MKSLNYMQKGTMSIDSNLCLEVYTDIENRARSEAKLWFV